MIRRLLKHPLLREMDTGFADQTELNRRIIQEKPFLQKIYQEWYREIIKSLPPLPGAVLELGSGAGFFNHFCPQGITSDIFLCSLVNVVLDGQRLPFEDQALSAIIMTDVFHHFPQPSKFLAEAVRCLAPGGVISLIEPWVTRWSAVIYKKFHHEAMLPDAPDWKIDPLCRANQALPWIVFQRDRQQFERAFPQLEIRLVRPFMPFRYLLSGGLSMRCLMPGWSFEIWREFERLLSPCMGSIAMFAHIILERCPSGNKG